MADYSWPYFAAVLAADVVSGRQPPAVLFGAQSALVNTVADGVLLDVADAIHQPPVHSMSSNIAMDKEIVRERQEIMEPIPDTLVFVAIDHLGAFDDVQHGLLFAFGYGRRSRPQRRQLIDQCRFHRPAAAQSAQRRTTHDTHKLGSFIRFFNYRILSILRI